jgi:hypothetical protein
MKKFLLVFITFQVGLFYQSVAQNTGILPNMINFPILQESQINNLTPANGLVNPSEVYSSETGKKTRFNGCIWKDDEGMALNKKPLLNFTLPSSFISALAIKNGFCFIGLYSSILVYKKNACDWSLIQTIPSSVQVKSIEIYENQAIISFLDGSGGSFKIYELNVSSGVWSETFNAPVVLNGYINIDIRNNLAVISSNPGTYGTLNLLVVYEKINGIWTNTFSLNPRFSVALKILNENTFYCLAENVGTFGSLTTLRRFSKIANAWQETTFTDTEARKVNTTGNISFDYDNPVYVMNDSTIAKVVPYDNGTSEKEIVLTRVSKRASSPFYSLISRSLESI